MGLNRMIGGRFVAAVAFAALGVLAASASADAPDTVRFGKGFPLLFQFTPTDGGVETGIFKKHGLDAEISAFVDTNMLPEKPDMSKLYTEKFLPAAMWVEGKRVGRLG